MLCIACHGANAGSDADLLQLRLSTGLDSYHGARFPDPPAATPAPAGALRLAQAGSSQAGPDTGKPSVMFLTVRINGRELSDIYRIVRADDGSLLVNIGDFRRWRLRPPATLTRHQGQDHVALNNMAGLGYSIDGNKQELLLQVAPALFEEERFALSPDRSAAPAPPGWGGFLNYDALAQRTGNTDTVNGLVELGVFSPLGIATSSHLGQDLNRNRQAIRLETTFVRDLPEQRSSLRVGDALTRPGATGLGVRFGGLQWATNFATQPGFIPYPLPDLRGEATVPSTVDIFINNALGVRGQVQPGPFEITRLPVVTGQGEVRLVQRDFLGREIVRNVPYYVSPLLLQQGLDEFNYQAGFVRQNFGIENDDYGRAFFSGLHRRGLSSRMTGEVRGEILSNQQTLGIGGSYLYRDIGTLSAAMAASHSPAGSGHLTLLQAERQTRLMSFGVRLQSADDSFAQLGSSQAFATSRKQKSVNFGHATGIGSFGASYTSQERRDSTTVRIITASYSLPLPGGFFLSFSALQTDDNGIRNHSVGATLVKALGERSSVAASTTRQSGSTEGIVQYQQNLPSETGSAFRALVGTGITERQEAGMSWQTQTGLYSLDAGRSGNVDNFRVNAAGGIVTMDGNFFLSRRLEDSFAMVDVPGYAGLSVYQNNQLTARTDGSGKALLPRLLPYQENRVRIDAAELPMDAEVGVTEILAVPYLRSGVTVRFPVRPGSGALLVLVDEKGEALPEGAAVRIGSRVDEFFVARRGETYVTGLADGDLVSVSWQKQRCTAKAVTGPGAGLVPRIGPLTCTAVQP